MISLDYELAFWGDCLNTYGEESKHLVYAGLMGVPPNLMGLDVLDVGGGPVSMLLKLDGRGDDCTVVDPLLDQFPAWVLSRYEAAGIRTIPMRGEDIVLDGFDESWIYNVLQHVDDPELVVANARRASRIVRMFEWIDTPSYEGHPNALTQPLLERWLGGPGVTIDLDQNGCVGRAFFGLFIS